MPSKSSTVRVQRARCAALARYRPDDDPALIAARARLGDELFIQAVEKAIAAAPPLTPELRERVVGLLSVA